MLVPYTDKAKRIMVLASQEALRFNHEYVSTEHFLLGLVKDGSGIGAGVLRSKGLDLERVRLEVEKQVKTLPDKVVMGKLPLTPRAKILIEFAAEESRRMNTRFIGSEHLLLGMLREHDGIAGTILLSLGLQIEDAREEVLKLVSAAKPNIWPRNAQLSPVPDDGPTG